MRVLVFGDSIAQGFWDHEGGWVQRLRRDYDRIAIADLDHDTQPSILNVAISGDKSDSILSRLEQETIARRWHDEELALIIAVGVNDSYEKGGKPYASPKTYAANLDAIIKVARTQSRKILFLELTPCDESRTNPVSWDNICWSNQRIAEFNKTLQEVCRATNLPVVEIFDLFKRAQQTRNLLADGIHPNDDGHELIASLVKPELENLLQK